MPHVNFNEVETKVFGPLPIGKYPCFVRVEPLMRDDAGNVMTGGDGEPAKLRTADGAERWNLTSVVMDGPHFDQKLIDNISFGKAVWRAKIVLIRAGIIPTDDECAKDPKLCALRDQDFQAEELDGSCWWVTVSGHVPGQNRDGSPKLSKAGKPIMYPDIAADGYERMEAADAKRFRAMYAQRKANQTPAPDASDNNHGAGDTPF